MQPQYQEESIDMPSLENGEGNIEAVDDDSNAVPLDSFEVRDLSPARDRKDDALADLHEEINQEILRDVRPILKVIEGNILQKTETLMKDYGGTPRGWSRFEEFSQFADMDPVELALWTDQQRTESPRALLRKKKMKGGALAIIRDISSSMTGSRSHWSSMFILGLIQLVRKKRMKLGYIEFNHHSKKYMNRSAFFSRAYKKVSEVASRCRCNGFTNYQLPLQDAFREFRDITVRGKHIVFITDGRPTDGDREIAGEISQAQRENITVHSIYIGKREPPDILYTLSDKTGGAHFQVGSDDDGRIRLSTVRNPHRGFR
jgi:Mg-chelatase subunit ChlD